MGVPPQPTSAIDRTISKVQVSELPGAMVHLKLDGRDKSNNPQNIKNAFIADYG